MASHFELSPDAYERSRAGHLHRRRVGFLAAVVARVPAGGRVVEVGCGPGSILADLASGRPDVAFLGLDESAPMAEYARTRHRAPNLRFAAARVGEEGIEGRADAVLAVDVLHHVHEPDAFLAAVRDALVPGGVLAAVEPNSLHPAIALKQERMRRRGLDEAHFRPRRWETAFARAGLELRSKGYLHAIPGGIERVPAGLARAERLVERLPPLAGSVVYVLGRPAE